MADKRLVVRIYHPKVGRIVVTSVETEVYKGQFRVDPTYVCSEYVIDNNKKYGLNAGGLIYVVRDE